MASASTLLARERTPWLTEPKLVEVLGLVLLGATLFFCTVLHFRSYRSAVAGFGDSGGYLAVADGIQHWDFRGLDEKQFWGYPYAIAALSRLTGIPIQGSFFLVSFLSSLLSTALVFRLWGGWPAALFGILNFDWIQRSYLGGSESLFVLLLFACFWAARRQRWILASVLGALATITRPVGMLALIALGTFLIFSKRFRLLGGSVAVGLIVGSLYVLPFWLYFGDAFYQVHRYQKADWHSGPALYWPFYAIGQSLLHNQQPWTNVLLSLAWIAIVVLGAYAIYRNRSRLAVYPVELLFALGYIAFLFCYNSRQWARAEFSRFAIPVLPLIYVSLFTLLSESKWRIQDRRVLWILGVVSPVLAACSALGIRNVLAALRSH